MALTIPLNTNSPYYQQTTTINGFNYLLEFKFNYREQSWYMGIYNNNNELLLSSIKLLDGFNLLKNYSYKIADNLFPNPLLLINNNEINKREIAYENMGIEYELVLLEEGEY